MELLPLIRFLDQVCNWGGWDNTGALRVYGNRNFQVELASLRINSNLTIQKNIPNSSETTCNEAV